MNNEPVAWRCKKFYETQEGWFYNENEIGEPLYTHPVKEQHLSLQKTEDGELVAVTYTDDEHRIVKVLWQKPPVKELTDEEIEIEWFKVFKPETGIGKNLTNGVYEFALAILRKAQEK